MPDAVAGFSLGEIPALAFTGVLSDADAFDTVVLRGNTMQTCGERHPGGMAAVMKLPPEEVERIATTLGLSPREAQVASLLCQSKSVGYISKKLGVANSTTKTHVRHVYEKANVHSRDELQLELERLLKKN